MSECSAPPDLLSLPHTIPSEHLTQRVEQMNCDLPCPFADDPTYESFFDGMCRALHRSSPRHVLLVRERGVGEQAVLLDLARRGLAGTPHFLRDRQIIAADCRRVPEEQITGAIDAVFAAISKEDTVILCVDGFANLFQEHHGVSNRKRLLNALVRTSARIVGIVSPHEYEEHVAADADALELFSIVH